jgi:hypothetical protein
VEVTRLKKKVA